MTAPALRSVTRRTSIALVAVAALLATTAVPTASAAPAPAAARQSVAHAGPGSGPDRDFSGDGIPDVLAITGDGDLVLYRGTADGPLRAGVRIGPGWNAFDRVFAAGDFSGDGHPDLLARDADGGLHLYRSNGAGGWLGATRVGSGWQDFTAILSPGDFDGDGAVDVIGRDATDRLRLYPGNGSGGWRTPVLYGYGWGAFKHLAAAGDLGFDGRADLVAVSSEPDPTSPYGCGGGPDDLRLYSGNGRGGFLAPTAIGSGWCPFNAVIGGGDGALVARDDAGNLWRYARSSTTGWAPAVIIGSGWAGLRLVG
jgi:hypothetical protein